MSEAAAVTHCLGQSRAMDEGSADGILVAFLTPPSGHGSIAEPRLT